MDDILGLMEMLGDNKEKLWWWELEQSVKEAEKSEDTEDPVNEPGETDLHMATARFRAVMWYLHDLLAETRSFRAL